jgi:hypothetical protein
MTILGIHQPGYLPWMGFFKKMKNSDIFVYLDDALFVKNNFYNRNKIMSRSGPLWLTVPILGHNELAINDVKIDNTQNWALKHKKSISFSYSKAEYFKDFSYFFEELYEKHHEKLIDLNMEIINFIKEQLDIKCKILFSSELEITSKGSEKILDVCKKLDVEHYISGTTWASEFLKVNDFEKNSITVEYQEFQHPLYNQMSRNFEPCMSIIDLLFNEGKDLAKKILSESDVTKKIVTRI